MAKNEFGIDLETATDELQLMVENSVNFIFSEFESDWQKAERYYAGGTDLPTTVGRSNVVKTEVRDAIRNVKPSIFRVLLQARKIVEYKPVHPSVAAWAELQSHYATQLFWKSNGYKALMNAVDDACKLKIGPMKVYFKESPVPIYFEMRRVNPMRLEELTGNENIMIAEVEETEEDENDLGALDAETTYTVTGYRYQTGGKLVIESVPPYEFFIDRNSDGIEDAITRGAHGQRRLATVAEAIELDIDYDDWMTLDYDDPEQNEFANSSTIRRGYQKNEENDRTSEDILRHEFLLTEAYVRFDIAGTGVPQLYRFWLGGSSYTYLKHEEVEDSPFEMMLIDPIAHSAIGHSLADLTINEQDLNTSILRAVADNFHMANNPRLGGDPMRVDFDDLMTPTVGAPIKVKGDHQVQVIATPFTGQAGLPLLEYLEKDVQQKVGVTKAAQGLDPDAMQSTDKAAVQNTIQLAQGQVELMVRNIVETCLIKLFRKLLVLSARYMDPTQIVAFQGQQVEVPQSIFDPDLICEPAVGLGTGDIAGRGSTLQFVLQKQTEMMAEHGLDNPFTSMAQVYNTIEDMCELGGVTNVGRYFTPVTPEVEMQYKKQKQDEAAKAAENAPPEPAEVMLQIETRKAEVNEKEALLKHAEHEMKLAQDALVEAEKADLNRDRMEQEREIKLAELQREDLREVIKADQAANNRAFGQPQNGGQENGQDTGANQAPNGSEKTA